MARNALTKQATAAAVSSSYKMKGKTETALKARTACKICKVEMDKYSWSKRQQRMIECSLCLPCWNKANPRKMTRDGAGNRNRRQTELPDETGVIMIGALEAPTHTSIQQDINVAPVGLGMSPGKKPILLDHHIFHSHEGWKAAESMQHPTLRLRLTTEKCDYDHIRSAFRRVTPSHVTTVTDTGAQSCLWGLQDFYRCGFKQSDLLPVKRVLLAANKEKIQIEGAIFVRLSGVDSNGRTRTAPIMAYVSPDTQRFYISKDFPRVGAAMETSVMEHHKIPCGCPTRTLPLSRPKALPFSCTPTNNVKMKGWLIERFAASTFNKCPHQQLPGMTGPDIKLHIDPTATPKAVHTPTTVPLHWQEEVERQLNDDISLGVLEKVPIGEPSLWCHRMVLVKKPDGTPRRTVDLSPLNQYCLRETHHVKPPFQQAKAIPPNTWKSVTDAWNGYHSVPIRSEDRHLTTFITPWGRYRYKVAPQGFLASGDGYTRRFDEIIADTPRKTKCVDDTTLWDPDLDLEKHWWRMIDFLELLGNNGIVLNEKKFQFAQKAVDFAGFHVAETEIRPLEKFTNAIHHQNSQISGHGLA